MGTNNNNNSGFSLKTPDCAVNVVNGDGWSFTPAPNGSPREALEAERAKLLADVDYMHENYEGCDWCCGGGDEWMEECLTRLDQIKRELADLDAGVPAGLAKLAREVTDLVNRPRTDGVTLRFKIGE